MKTSLLRLTFLFLITSCSLFSQQGWWTWMQGNNTINNNGVFGTIGNAAATNNPPALYQSFEWTDLNGNFWLFGGMDMNGSFFSAMWMYNPTTNMWTWVKGPNTTNAIGTYGTKGTPAPGNNPGSRLCGLSWVGNNGDLWLWGGYGFANSNTWTNLADLWKYDIASNQWTWMAGPNTANSVGVYGNIGVPAPANYPPPRSETNAAWTDNNGDLWLFGGFAYTSINNWYNDLWKYDIGLNQWVWMKGPNTTNSVGSYGTMGTAAPTNLPSARETFTKWKDQSGNLWLFGAGKAATTGNTYSALNDMWKYDPSTNNWTWVRGANTVNPQATYGTQCVSSPNNDPPARWESKACWTDTCGNFWMFGGAGKNQNAEYFNDLWYYNVQANEWMWVSGSNIINNTGSYGAKGVPAATNRPKSRAGAAAFLHKNTDLYLYGGMGGNTGSEWYSDLWRFVIDTSCVNMSCFIVNPIANFNSNTNGCVPYSVTFNNTSVNATSWNWNFGDGNTSTLQNPTNVYTNPGTYTVTLIASNANGSDTLVIANYITVYAYSVAAFVASDDTLCIGQSVTFTNSSTNSNSSSWNFGDGNTSTATSPTHTYGATGNYTVTLIALNANGCHDTITQNIIVVGAQVTAGAALNLNCTTTAGIISASSVTPNLTYNWSGPGIVSGGNTATPTVNAAGTYTVTVTDPVTGCTNSTTVIVNTNTTIPNITAGNPLQLTCTITNGNITATSTTAGVIYNWSGPGIVSGGTTITANVNAAGTYTVTVTDPTNGCTNTATVVVTSNTTVPNVTPGNPLILSCINPTGTITASSTSSGISYNWSGPGIVSNGNTNTPTVNNVGTYTVTVTDPSNGCTATATVSVTSNTPLPNVTAGGPLTLPCTPGATGSINVSSTTAGVTYSWSGPGIVSGNTTSSPVVNVAGTYTVIVTDPSNGCTQTATVMVTVLPGPTATVSPDVTITLGDSAMLIASGGGTYLWLPVTNLNPTTGNIVIASPAETIIYCVEVTDNAGCKDTACVTVNVEVPCPNPNDLSIVPNAFSPNNDGINDDFCLQGWSACIENFIVLIYDRWGEKVFESKDPNFCWDGKYRNKSMDAQVLVYYIKATYTNSENKIVKEGNISLIR